jgi:ABC-2 type transport system ATP-binding protein
VAEGTPAELKAEIGRPSVEAIPRDVGQREEALAVLRRFGEDRNESSPRGAAVRLTNGVDELASIVRALDEQGIGLANIELHQPTLDDVFLAKTGRSLEGAGDGDEAEDAELVPA